VVGAYDPLAMGGFMSIRAKAGLRYGGGARSALTPRIYDCLCPPDKDQKQVLSSYNEADFSYAVVFPVEVTAEPYIREKPRVDPRKLDALKKQAEEEAAAERTRYMQIADNSPGITGAEDIETAIALFNLGRFAQAEALLDAILERNPDHAEAFSYKGAVIAHKAESTQDLTEKMRYVQESFIYLKRGAALARSDDEKIHCYLCRAEVFMAVPEDVFAKNREAQNDLTAVIAILEKHRQENSGMIADMYIKLALCFLNLGEDDRAETAFLTAKSLPGLSARARLKLAERGY